MNVHHTTYNRGPAVRALEGAIGHLSVVRVECRLVLIVREASDGSKPCTPNITAHIASCRTAAAPPWLMTFPFSCSGWWCPVGATCTHARMNAHRRRRCSFCLLDERSGILREPGLARERDRALHILGRGTSAAPCGATMRFGVSGRSASPQNVVNAPTATTSEYDVLRVLCFGLRMRRKAAR